jgi:hypothetical protein
MNEEQLTKYAIEAVSDDAKVDASHSARFETLLSALLLEIRRLNKKEAWSSGNIELRWLNKNVAGKYCGNLSSERFRKVAKQYQIPSHGPHRKLYDKFELDE